jgi:hypothetical protein
MQTKTCPSCGDDIYINAKSHKCGWTEAGEKAGDPLRHTCAQVLMGQRCREFGTLTQNIQGGNGKEPHPGPWYCVRHFSPLAGQFGPRESPPMGFDGLRKLVINRPVRDLEAESERAAIQGNA